LGPVSALVLEIFPKASEEVEKDLKEEKAEKNIPRTHT